MADAPSNAASRTLIITTALATLVAVVVFVICSEFFVYPIVSLQELKLEGLRNRVQALEDAKAAAPAFAAAPAPAAPTGAIAAAPAAPK
jgi:hypothetical protein